jgi:hypothetical protein
MTILWVEEVRTQSNDNDNDYDYGKDEIQSF